MSAEEYLNAQGVTALVKSIMLALPVSSPAKQYWFNWFPAIEQDESNPSYSKLYLCPYFGEIDPESDEPTAEQFEQARQICNEADLLQGLGMLGITDIDAPDNYYVRVTVPLNVNDDQTPFLYDPVRGRFLMLSVYTGSSFDILDQMLIFMIIIPKIIVTIFDKEIIGTNIPLHPVTLPDWVADEEDSDYEDG